MCAFNLQNNVINTKIGLKSLQLNANLDHTPVNCRNLAKLGFYLSISLNVKSLESPYMTLYTHITASTFRDLDFVVSRSLKLTIINFICDIIYVCNGPLTPNYHCFATIKVAIEIPWPWFWLMVKLKVTVRKPIYGLIYVGNGQQF